MPLLLFVCADPLERSWGAGVLPARPGRSWGWRCGVHAQSEELSSEHVEQVQVELGGPSTLRSRPCHPHFGDGN